MSEFVPFPGRILYPSRELARMRLDLISRVNNLAMRDRRIKRLIDIHSRFPPNVKLLNEQLFTLLDEELLNNAREYQGLNQSSTESTPGVYQKRKSHDAESDLNNKRRKIGALAESAYFSMNHSSMAYFICIYV
ncbi:unnamed protein product [Protopolystoma xenopodis]|uniref:Uncharacterized protein n=1 Tax=Protopolystoma xenopodis TaxID=117903 RepID=A0A3S5FFW1_9PLAT|nr:unnamed protein product [Protopolystoma xenopodis]